MAANEGRSKALLAAQLVGVVILTTVLVSALGAFVIVSLVGDDDSEAEVEVVAPDAQGFESAAELVPALAESGHECVEVRTAQYTLPADAEDRVVDAVTCTYGYLPLHVLVYEDARARAVARADGLLAERLCASAPEVTGWSTVAGANWRLAAPVDGFDFTMLRDSFDSRAVLQAVTCPPGDALIGA
jgi:hypothetical protein